MFHYIYLLFKCTLNLRLRINVTTTPSWNILTLVADWVSFLNTQLSSTNLGTHSHHFHPGLFFLMVKTAKSRKLRKVDACLVFDDLKAILWVNGIHLLIFGVSTTKFHLKRSKTCRLDFIRISIQRYKMGVLGFFQTCWESVSLSRFHDWLNH